MCDAIRAPYIYKCHLNLSEAIAPIYENGVTIGYMMLGQVLLDTERESVLKAAKEIAPKHGLDTQKLLSELSKLKSVDSEFINTFEAAGINQTRHRMELEFLINVGMMFAGREIGVDVGMNVCVAETVIVGEIPKYFSEK